MFFFGGCKIKKDEEKQSIILENDQLREKVLELEKLLMDANSHINKLKLCEINLNESEESLRLINDNMVDVIGQVDTKGNLIYATSSLKSVIGYETDELMGKSIFEGIHPEDKDEILNEFKKIFHPTGKGVVVQYRFKHANGNYIWLETTSKAFFKDNILLGSTFSTRDISYRKEIEDQLKKALSERDTRIQDIHHRVKNNMQIIASLLSLQEQGIDDEKSLKVLHESQSRIKAMALVYQKLYQSSNFSNIELNSYVPNLVSELISSFGVEGYIAAEVEVEDIVLDINQIIPLALIINELVTNSIKYAFPNQEKGVIRVKIQQDRGKNSDYKMVVSDCGVGFSDDVDLNNPSTLGLQLVQNLVRQLDGDVVIDRNNGVRITITFNDPNKHQKT